MHSGSHRECQASRKSWAAVWPHSRERGSSCWPRRTVLRKRLESPAFLMPPGPPHGEPANQDEMDSGSPSLETRRSEASSSSCTRRPSPCSLYCELVHSFSPLLSFYSWFLALLWQETFLTIYICRDKVFCKSIRSGPCPNVVSRAGSGDVVCVPGTSALRGKSLECVHDKQTGENTSFQNQGLGRCLGQLEPL